MQIYDKLVEMVTEMKQDAEKFYNNGNLSAGTRVRVRAQEVKKIAQNLREDVSNVKDQLAAAKG